MTVFIIRHSQRAHPQIGFVGPQANFFTKKFAPQFCTDLLNP